MRGFMTKLIYIWKIQLAAIPLMPQSTECNKYS